MRTLFSSLLWTVPFISFLMGYLAIQYFLQSGALVVPSVVGLHIHDAIKLLSVDRLNVRILDEKIDPDVQEGVVVKQTPIAGQKVRPHQSIFLILTRRPPKPKAPSLFGLPAAELATKSQEAGFSIKSYEIPSKYPQATVIAQSAIVGSELALKSMTVYTSSGITPLRIVPDITGKSVEEVASFFKPYGFKLQSFHPGADKSHECKTCLISEQRPLAGTIIDISKELIVYITVQDQP